MELFSCSKEEKETQENCCVVRLATSIWSNNDGVFFKKSLYYLRRKSKGYNILQEEVDAMSCSDAYRSIVNLDDYSDGVYRIGITNESHDFESGLCDGYDLILIPYEED